MSERATADVLIIGAGPFGLSMAAEARRRNIDYVIVGEPMSFWREHMPAGMLLRSGTDWHLDPADEATVETFLQERELPASEAQPLSLSLYLEYCDWFQRRCGIEPRPTRVQRLDRSALGSYVATCDGAAYEARSVVIAVGFEYFAHVPPELAVLLPPERFEHTCRAVDLSRYRNRRVLIVGGRQSAFEWAALLREAGAGEIFVSYRHTTPRFAESDWNWVMPMLEDGERQPGWFRELGDGQRQELDRRFWSEGRLKLEPWLTPRIDAANVHLRPETQITSCDEQPDGSLLIGVGGDVCSVDDVILATGYRVDLRRVPFLAAGEVLEAMDMQDGFPVLSEHMESNLPGLFFTSFAAVRDFGPFYAFTVSARISARTIGTALDARAAVA